MDNKLASERHRDPRQDFTLGLALSGGGARGFAHAGALKAIDEAGLTVDVIAGVSAGSIVAVLYAAGLKPDTILEMFVDARFLDLAEFTLGKGGFLRIERFTNYITRTLGPIKNLEDLRIPTYVGVTDFDHGVPVTFDRGLIGPIVAASCSIPIAITPVVIDGTTYVDGGVLRNLPAVPIRDKCDKLIGVNVSPMMSDKRDYNSLMSIALRSYTLLAKANQAHDMELCDLVLKMDEVSQHRVFSLKEITQIFEAGYKKMRHELISNGLWLGPIPTDLDND